MLGYMGNPREEVDPMKSEEVKLLAVLLFTFFFVGQTFADHTIVRDGNDWIARYDGNAAQDDRAWDLAIDGVGNVYVTGESWGQNTYLDYATVKYDPNGVPQWVARYNGPGNGPDSAYAIVVDNSGYVYVTGSSSISASTTDGDYATIKYGCEGNEMWVARYDGPANDYDYAIAIAVDNSGNVYVSGSSWGIHKDYATIKYDPNGNQLWVARYNGPQDASDEIAALAVEDSGNVYVTGGSDGYPGTDYDYATIKYDTNGNELWVARYDGPAGGTDYADGLAVDNSGNVYVTGGSTGIATGYYDYATIKYDTNGNLLWVGRYNGQANDSDYARDIVVDALGNICVTGWSYAYHRETRNEDYLSIKYDPSGTELWASRYNGAGGGCDRAQAINIGHSGNVYITGSSDGYESGGDYATIKYDSTGNQLWVARYSGPTDKWGDWASALAIDNLDNVYVTGYSDGNGTLDYATLKYTKDDYYSGQIVLLTPNNGEELVGGSRYNITWETEGVVENVLIEYSIDNGGNWIVVDTVENTGSYFWEVPLANSQQCLVSVSDAIDAGVSDVSDTVFTIYRCTLVSDLNHDCVISLVDLAFIANDWLECGDPMDSNCTP